MSATPPRVEVWHDTVDRWSDDPDRIARGLAWLTETERIRYGRFVHDEDRWMFLAGRVMARTLVGRALGCPPTAWKWREGRHGRPEIDAPDATWRFNVAHSAGLIVCALADGVDVGIDVEDLERRPVGPGFIRRYLSPIEAADVEALPPAAQHERVLTYWTLKESYLKACGLGVSVPLAEITFTLADGRPRVAFHGSLAGTAADWHFRLERPTPRHVMATAVRGTGVFATGQAFSETGLP
jgi:4'-phosphopantetheinyl transferase